MSADAIIAETTACQRLAADPSLSAFVPANAGAGKTKVLTSRVARLLLEGVPPSAILCITFTKAAAAEMADRLFKLLGAWSLAGDDDLTQGLADLDGDKARPRSREDLSRARRLFAQALETPGGLKIQTIHSFCESVLKRFPLEAGVAPGFTVLSALEAGAIARAAVDETAATRKEDAAIDAAFGRLLARMSGGNLRLLIENAATGGRRLFARADEIGWRAFAAEAREALGAGESVAALERRIAHLRPREVFVNALAAYVECGGKPAKFGAPPLRKYLSAGDDARRAAALADLFLTQDGEERKDFATKALDTIDPSVRAFYNTVQAEFLPLRNALAAAHAAADTEAFYVIVEATLSRYAAAKAARGALDFDDLIFSARRLLSDEGKADWVLYKLDQGVEHILLDEAQDTGPDAWAVVEQPLKEFFSGAGVRSKPRTFFAVGDKKQSIYSFQGADAELFDAKEIALGKRIAAVAAYRNVQLKASFRTTAPVLRFVDAMFARQAVFEGVSDSAPEHLVTREGDAGVVEIWPLVPREKAPPEKAWDAPLDRPLQSHPSRRLAEAVAAEIKGWLDRREPLASAGRPIAPGDVMILVQKRKALFHEIIRALARSGVPVAGADRMMLVEDQAVLDLLSYARAALYEGDDLSLAETLKSPFFNVGEESLYDLAAAREEPRLWRALRARAHERAEWEEAARSIASARAVAVRDGPVAFFHHILETGAPSGWRRLAARLGAPSREPIEEFLRLALDFEASNPRSLRLFLDAVLASDAEANRESAEAGGSVRVLTAHKAKGLEANIVFMLDAHCPPNFRNNAELTSLAAPSGARLPAVAIGEGQAAAAVSQALERSKRRAWEEYRRLLYVAATRARDRLYICGHEHGKGDPRAKPPGLACWHSLALDAFDTLGGAVETGGEKFGGRIRRLSSPQGRPAKSSGESPSAPIAAPMPAWLSVPPLAETRPRRMSPSALAPEEDGAYAPGGREGAFLRGRILHRLLELLPETPPDRRSEAALKIARRGGGAESAQALAAEAMRVLDDPRFAPVFAPGSLAEVAIGGVPKGARPGLALSGQIDRMAIGDRRILIVDYKTNRPPSARVEDVAAGYIAQLAAYRALLQEIYPAHEIEAALLWTYDARLMPIPAGRLDDAFAMTLA